MSECFICGKDAPFYHEEEELQLVEHLLMENYICLSCVTKLKPHVDAIWEMGLVPMLLKQEKETYVDASVEGKYSLSYSITESAAKCREIILEELKGVEGKSLTLLQLLHFIDEVIGESLMGGNYLPEGNQANTVLDALLYIIIGRKFWNEGGMKKHY